MRKLLSVFAPALLLAAITPAPPARADRSYTLCDPFASKFCRGLVALYEFEQDANSSRSSETGSALLTESVNTVARSATHRTGSYSADFVKGGLHPTLHLLDTVGFSGTFTMSVWIRFDANEWSMSSGLYEYIAGMVTASAEGYPRLVLYNNAGTYEFRYYVQQAMNDTVSYVAKSFTPQAETWYMVTWGAYPSPTTSEPYQMTLWIQVNAGARATQTITYEGSPDVGNLILGPYQGNAGYYLDQLGVWAWPWSTGNVTSMYNSGSGREYPFTF